MRLHSGHSVISGPALISLTVKGHFDAAHELIGYPGECRDLHGHTWDVEVTVSGTALDEVGIVYDFKRLKEDLSAVLEPLDHSHLNQVAPFDRVNPTAENLAREICKALQDRIGPQVTITEVSVWESPVARIVYRPE
jgi:6-pyruvoyltetrahydropterin/6-carboxytetrahydropterin synthase